MFILMVVYINLKLSNKGSPSTDGMCVYKPMRMKDFSLSAGRDTLSIFKQLQMHLAPENTTTCFLMATVHFPALLLQKTPFSHALGLQQKIAYMFCYP